MQNSADRAFKIIGLNVSARRRKMGMSQEKFAKHIGISVNVVKDIERGAKEGHIETRLLFAHTFKCTLGDLYNEKILKTDRLRKLK